MCVCDCGFGVDRRLAFTAITSCKLLEWKLPGTKQNKIKIEANCEPTKKEWFHTLWCILPNRRLMLTHTSKSRSKWVFAIPMCVCVCVYARVIICNVYACSGFALLLFRIRLRNSCQPRGLYTRLQFSLIRSTLLQSSYLMRPQLKSKHNGNNEKQRRNKNAANFNDAKPYRRTQCSHVHSRCNAKG